MRCTNWICLGSAVWLLSFGVHSFARQPLTFEERVKAQEAIERVYYSHRIWPKENPGSKPPFEQMVPRDQMEAKVTDCLKKSAALDQYWQRPITGEQLQAEMDRMAKGTKDPVILLELFAALDNDPTLIAECLGRPALADRLIRSWYAYDARFHAQAQTVRDAASKPSWWSEGSALATPKSLTYRLESMENQEGTGGEALCGGILPIRDLREWESLCARHSSADNPLFVEETDSAVRVERTVRVLEKEILVEVLSFPKKEFGEWWPQASQSLPADAAPVDAPRLYRLPAVLPNGAACGDRWEMLPAFIEPRRLHTAVWTGSEMIVWGGQALNSTYLATGWRYSPSLDTWWPTAAAPTGVWARIQHAAVWTGTEMIVWGGSGGSYNLNTGARYDPAADTWVATSTGASCPEARYGPTVVWTGTSMIIWGGGHLGTTLNDPLNTGGRYDPASNSWAATSVGGGCPVARRAHIAVWTGAEMIVWGGVDSTTTYYNSGGRYNPVTDTWVPTSIGSGCPTVRRTMSYVWTGSVMVVWGGYGGSYLNTGGRYDPTADSWLATATTAGCPSARQLAPAVWSGTEMILFGGYNAGEVGGGGRYNPTTNNWAALSGTSVPSSRYSHTAVWTGSEMIVWGGTSGATLTNSGGRYSPLSDSWVPTRTGFWNQEPRRRHSAIWTGVEMIVWGGINSSAYLRTGGCYTPATDTWYCTPTGSGCPPASYEAGAVWTGTRMVVWGGHGEGGVVNTGGRYDPTTDTWSATSLSGACPTAREGFSTVWTGTEMIVWGGWDEILTAYNTGGRYNPTTNSWAATSTAAPCPPATMYHTGVWTGSEMVVWGGGGNEGGRYNPISNIWRATSTAAGCPLGRNLHTAIWTGSRMIIWGGAHGLETGGEIRLDDGASYDPTSDAWLPISSTPGRPGPRIRHTALWTGSEMIVWGGYNTDWFNTGGRYSPANDSWAPTPTDAGCPYIEDRHTSIWTGTSMIVWGMNWGSTGIGGILKFDTAAPAVIGGSQNLCPVETVSLSAPGGYTGYQWLRDGAEIPGCVLQTYLADVAGNFTFRWTDSKGCQGTSLDHPITLSFCSNREVSPSSCATPCRIEKSSVSSTGYFLYFERVPTALGYNLYEGALGSFYSHADAPGNSCGLITTDLGTGEMRAEITPSTGNQYYLVTGYGGGAEGPSGYNSQGQEIPMAQSTCTP